MPIRTDLLIIISRPGNRRKMKKEKGKILLKNLVANVFAAITIVARITGSRCVGAMAVLATASAVAVPPPHAPAHARQWAVVLFPLLSRMRCSRGSGIASSQIIRSFLRSDVDSSSYHDVLNDSRNGSIDRSNACGYRSYRIATRQRSKLPRRRRLLLPIPK